jgi:D-threo-aldose 1-dehydrogenase
MPEPGLAPSDAGRTVLIFNGEGVTVHDMVDVAVEVEYLQFPAMDALLAEHGLIDEAEPLREAADARSWPRRILQTGSRSARRPRGVRLDDDDRDSALTRGHLRIDSAKPIWHHCSKTIGESHDERPARSGRAAAVSRADADRQLERRRIGRTETYITTLGLGGGALGGLYDPVTEDAAMEAVQRAYELGVRYFDTAPLYGHGRSEERLGRALAGIDRSSYVLSTKVGVVIDPVQPAGHDVEVRYADPFLLDGTYDFSYDGALRSLEASMKRIGTDRVDIVYIHDPDEADSAVAPEARRGADHLNEVMDGAYRALHELREQGVIQAIGVGLNGTEMLARFARAGDFDCFLLAGRYTLLEQEGLDDLLPLCVERGISIVCGGVFNSGILVTGTSVPAPKYNYDDADEVTRARVLEIEELCERDGVALPAAALQFPLGHPAVATVIPGVRDPGEVEGNVRDITSVIPDRFWHALSDRGLVNPDAPLPVGADRPAPASRL